MKGRLARLAAPIVVVALALTGLVAVPAQAVSPGHITGTIVPVESGRDVGTGWVLAVPLSDTMGTYQAAFSPAFDISLPAGKWRLQIQSTNPVGVNSVTPSFGADAATLAAAPIITVTAGKTTAVGAQAVAAGGTISGTVSAGGTVSLYSPTGTVLAIRGPVAGAAYSFGGLRAGDYRVGLAAANSFPAFWPDVRTLADAGVLSLTTGESRTGVDLTAHLYPQLSGLLSTPVAGDDHAYATLRVIDAATRAVVSSTSVRDAWTRRVPPGTYLLEFRREVFSGGPGTVWYGGSAGPDGATPVTVGESDVTGLDATLLPTGSAVVTLPLHDPKFSISTEIPAIYTIYRLDTDGTPIALPSPLSPGSHPSTQIILYALTPGTYTIGYHIQGADPLYADGFLGDVHDIADAQTFDVTADHRTEVTVTMTPIPHANMLRDIDGDGHADLLYRTSTGALYVAYGNGTGGIRGTALLTSTIPKTTRLFAGGDFTGGGDFDLLAVPADGSLWRYSHLDPADPADSSSARLIPPGYQTKYNVFVGSDSFNDVDDSPAQYFVRDKDGRLAVEEYIDGVGVGLLWVGDFHSLGWKSLTALVSTGDFDGDGTSDLIARDAAGVLWLYPGNGAGNFSPRVRLGSGWASLTALWSVGDFDGDGHSDVLARDGAGTVWIYPGDGHGHLLARKLVVKNWKGLGILA